MKTNKQLPNNQLWMDVNRLAAEMKAKQQKIFLET